MIAAAAEEDGEDEADDGDELEREQLLTFLELAVVKCLDEQTAVNQEKDMLETMVRMNAASDKQDLFSDVHRPTAPPQGQGIVRDGSKACEKSLLVLCMWRC